ncbi:MAG: hypothetical protein M1828_002459 [Chrysothrix sp. TS-e1954]|nr:MAG: hypothetical protein M1828_002459 [Chrysothrix sp. TS-e1954]
MGVVAQLWEASSRRQLIGFTGISVIVITIAYLVARATYRLTLHPLAGFPGPKLRAISHLPTALANSQGREPYAIRDLHEKYGSLVRINPNTLSIIDPDAWKDIYGQQTSRNFEKKGYHSMRPGCPELLTATGDNHARQRSTINHAFSDKALKDQEPLIRGYVDLLLKKLQETTDDAFSPPIDLVRWFEFVAFDIIGDLAFSTHFDCLESSDHHPWVLLLMDFFKGVSFATNAKLFGPLMPLIMLFAPLDKLRKGKDHLRMSAEKVQERLARPADVESTDFWTYILRSKDERTMSVPEMEVNAAFILLAGSETVASALSGLFYYLAQNPDVLGRLRSELESNFTAEKDVTISNTAALPWLKATIDEALRLYPPFPIMLRRTSPDEGSTACGRWIPGNASIGITLLAAFQSAQNFAQPQRYAPERWLTGKERPDWAMKDRLDACQPFSAGPRNCVGKTLAYAELRLITALLVIRFDFELQNDGFRPELQKVYLIREKPALRMKLRTR